MMDYRNEKQSVDGQNVVNQEVHGSYFPWLPIFMLANQENSLIKTDLLRSQQVFRLEFSFNITL
jgi:hypothetical protein